jgi:hypothetical protein
MVEVIFNQREMDNVIKMRHKFYNNTLNLILQDDYIKEDEIAWGVGVRRK